MGGIVGWVKDKVYGKIDPNPVFDGMEERPRRNTHLRREFFEKSTKLYQDEFSKYNNIVRNGAPSNDDWAKYFYYFVLQTLYKEGPDRNPLYDSYLEDVVLHKIFSWAHIDTNFAVPSWVKALERLREHTAAKHFIPSFLDERMLPRWERAKFLRLDKIRQEEEKKKAEEAKLKALKEADAKYLTVIAQLRQEVRDLRSLFYPLPVGHPEKTRLMFRIEAIQNGIDDLKRKLNVPIPKASEDWA